MECEKCCAKFTTRQSLRRHVARSHGKKERKCRACGLKFPCQTDLEVHTVANHPDERIYFCSKCDASFSKHCLLESHKRAHQEAGSCKICGKYFLFLRGHMLTHVPINERVLTKGVLCGICGVRVVHYTSHMRKHDGQEKPYVCPECGKRFGLKRSFVTHQRKHTGEESSYLCGKCGTSFKSRSTYHRHKVNPRGCLSSRQEQSVCGICGEHVLYYRSHMRKHGQYKPYNCLDCGKRYCYKRSLLIHRQEHTGEKPSFVCVKCGRSFRHQSGLCFHRANPHLCQSSGEAHGITNDTKLLPASKNILSRKRVKPSLEKPSEITNAVAHVINEMVENLFLCNECHATFPSRYSLDLHERFIHRGELPPIRRIKKQNVVSVKDEILSTAAPRSCSCTECNEIFPSAYLFSVHRCVKHCIKQLKETKPRNIRCRFCSDVFATRHRLFRHQCPSRPVHQCSKCDRCFLREQELLSHLDSCTDNSSSTEPLPCPFACTQCDKCFYFKHELQYHLEQHYIDSSHRCVTCAVLFKTSAELNKHKLIHNSVESVMPKSKDQNLDRQKEKHDIKSDLTKRRYSVFSKLQTKKSSKKSSQRPESPGFLEDMSKNNALSPKEGLWQNNDGSGNSAEEINIISVSKSTDIDAKDKGYNSDPYSVQWERSFDDLSEHEREFHQIKNEPVEIDHHVPFDENTTNFDDYDTTVCHGSEQVVGDVSSTELLQISVKGEQQDREMSAGVHYCQSVKLRSLCVRLDRLNENIVRNLESETVEHECTEYAENQKFSQNDQSLGNFLQMRNLHKNTQQPSCRKGPGSYRCVSTECRICSEIQDSVTALYRHMKEKHPGEKPFECKVCGKKFKHYDFFKVHKNSHVEKYQFECQQCDMHFINYIQLFKHKLAEHGHKITRKGRPKYICKVCNEGLYSQPQLEAHTVANHPDVYPFSCTKCSATFVNVKSMVLHRAHFHYRRPCPVCNKQLSHSFMKAHLASHLSTKSTIKPYICDICGKGFLSTYNRKSHMIIHRFAEIKIKVPASIIEHNLAEPSANAQSVLSDDAVKSEQVDESCLRRICEFCGKSFPHHFRLLRHVRSCGGEKPHGCPHCDCRFARKEQLKRHALTCTRVKVGRLDTKGRSDHEISDYICSICDKQFSSQVAFILHSRVHKEENYFHCDKCGRRFFQKSHYERHQQIPDCESRPPKPKKKLAKKPIGLQEDKLCECYRCGAMFPNILKYAEHITLDNTCDRNKNVTGDGGRFIFCGVCGKKAQSRAYLIIHIRIHTGEKPHACSHCDMRFARKEHLKRHMQTCTQGIIDDVITIEVPHTCTHCSRKFARKDRLTQHMLTCAQGIIDRQFKVEKPHSCPHCDSRFALKHQLKRHSQTCAALRQYLSRA